MGIEHGFTVEEDAAKGASVGPLVLELALAGGLDPRLSDDGRTVDLYAGAGSGRLEGHYSELHARDARGRVLDARLGVGRGAIIISVDDSSAIYPITIDPFLALHTQLAEGGGPVYEGWLAMAADGSMAVVGSTNNEAYIYASNGGTWPSMPAQALFGATGDDLGEAVALGGNSLVVSAKGNSRAYFYTLSGNTWVQAPGSPVTASGASSYFGYPSVALSADGNTALIGDIQSAGGNGAAYVFVNSGGTWTVQQELVASDGMAGDFFGWATALSSDGNTALISSSGVFSTRSGAYFFKRSGTTWGAPQKVVAIGGAPTDAFGEGVALVGDTAFIGAPAVNNSDGAVYVFEQCPVSTGALREPARALQRSYRSPTLLNLPAARVRRHSSAKSRRRCSARRRGSRQPCGA